MTEEQSQQERDRAKTRGVQTGENVRAAAGEREGAARGERDAPPTRKTGGDPGAGYWEGMRPEDSSDMSMDKTRFGVFEKRNDTGPTVARQGEDSPRDVKPMNQSGLYAEKDNPVWKEMAKKGQSDEAKDAEWCGTPSDESCEIVGAPTRPSAAGREADRPGGDDETPVTGKQGQHWRGEPWAKNPKVGGREKGGETGSETSGQHWRGDEPPEGRATREESDTSRQQRTSGEGEKRAPDTRPDEC